MDLKGQKAVVCGAGGFIAGHLIQSLLANGVEVIRDGKHTGAKPGRVVRGPGWHATEGKER